MHMHNKISHVGIVDGALCGILPSGISFLITRKNTDDIQLAGVFELIRFEIL